MEGSIIVVIERRLDKWVEIRNVVNKVWVFWFKEEY